QHFGLVSTFTHKDGKFFVRTDGPDGKLQEYPIKDTFGVDPLQQYLIPFPDGRLQALSIAWDSRPAAQGGQRWFHLYPDEKIPAGDILHWTGPYQNWNFMCAECHSTDVKKGYQAAEDSYKTTWSEINVACEACHGPGSEHVAWAGKERDRARGLPEGSMGLVIRLKDADGGSWLMDRKTGIAKRSRPRLFRVEVETCARCHARRATLSEDYAYGQPIMNTHRVALLEEELYFPDGQVKGEVYEYGSFLQSKMYAEGVTCHDCHDPHSATLSASGNAVCARCHLPGKFDSTSHHHHRSPGPGSRCVDCHMPTTNFMVVDARHDHSMRIPRPDLTLKIGSPNACSKCHAETSPQWAADWAVKWWGSEKPSQPHYGEAIQAGRAGLPGAGQALAALLSDQTRPGIVRASAVALVGTNPPPDPFSTLQTAL
ncbi:MAG: NapC/NirT family cytochrome c, partial [Acidobacteria bacterium]|nr:NapC/NirT family cytochrome c [Acidobacteriota bacterium]